MKPSFTKSFAIGLTTALAVVGASSSATGQGMTGFSDFLGGHVFYVGTDAHIHQLYDSNAHIWSNQDLTIAAGTAALASGSGLLTSFHDAGGEFLFYVSTDSHVHQLAIDNGPWTDADLTKVAGSSVLAEDWLSSFADAAGRHVFYVGTDNHIHELVQSPPRCFHLICFLLPWRDQDLTAQAGTHVLPAFRTQLTSFGDAQGEHVFYIGNTDGVAPPLCNSSCGDVHELISGNQAVWSDLNLTVSAQTSSIALAISSSFSDAEGEHLFYIGDDLGVHMLVCCPGAAGHPWVDQDLTAFRGSIQALAEAGTGLSDAWGEHAFYVGADSDVHQFFNSAWIPWLEQNLTRLAGGASACFVGASFADSAGEHVFYLGNYDLDVHELSLANLFSAPWVDQNLTTLTGGTGPLSPWTCGQ
jgi:hypothetical protein